MHKNLIVQHVYTRVWIGVKGVVFLLSKELLVYIINTINTFRKGLSKFLPSLKKKKYTIISRSNVYILNFFHFLPFSPYFEMYDFSSRM